jgi:tetratricopeptide (TPR) repeat protein
MRSQNSKRKRQSRLVLTFALCLLPVAFAVRLPAGCPSAGSSMPLCLGGDLSLMVLTPMVAYSQVADDPMTIAQRAWQLQQAGDYAAAVDAYRAFLKLRPDEAGARSNLGAALVKLGRYDEAIEEYQKAEKLLPGERRIGVNLALAYEKSGRVREAAQKLATLHAEAPQERQVTLLLADCDLQLGDYDRVIELLQPVDRDDPSDLATAYMLGTALIRTRRIAEGQVLLDRILGNGDSAEARFLLGTQFFESADYPAAVKELAGAIELNPSLPQLQSFYGLSLLNTGDPIGAAAAFRKELAENPNDYASNLALGQILIVSKEYAKALPLIEAALLNRPDSTEAGLALGECLSGAGKLQEARGRLEAVTRAVPASLQAHRDLLSVYTRLHLEPEAARERATVSRLDREAAAKERGAQINALAPDFELPEVGQKRQVRLSDFRGKTPVVLVFGSYSCPNFRASADALNALFQHYGRQTPFFLVYIREAHSAGDWQSTRNAREGITVAPALTMQDREDHAVMCTRELHLKFPALLDRMDGSVEAAYAAWPSRAFVIGADGRVRYGTRLTQLDFHAEEMERALRAAIARQ